MSQEYDFFKEKEKNADFKLDKKSWFVIRIDGKAFHSFTKKLTKPFDSNLSDAMVYTSKKLCEEIQNVKLAYTQSDEISLLLTDTDQENTNLWFDGKVQKIASVSASMATAFFNKRFKHPENLIAFFDARVFSLTKEEVIKYFFWRQRDCIKNSITLVALKHFSNKEIKNKKGFEKIEMIKSKGDSIDSYYEGFTHGVTIVKEVKKVPFKNLNSNKVELVERKTWEEEVIKDFSKVKIDDII